MRDLPKRRTITEFINRARARCDSGTDLKISDLNSIQHNATMFDTVTKSD